MRTSAATIPPPSSVLAANDLPPLSKANFLVHLAGRQAADANLLIALVSAHAALEAAAIFEILKDRRSRAGFMMTSLVGVEQGLHELQALHFNVVMDAYRPARAQPSRCWTVPARCFPVLIDIVSRRCPVSWMPTAGRWPA